MSTCKTCQFVWVTESAMTETLKKGVFCRRWPPVFFITPQGTQVGFPPTTYDQVCGEWSLRKEVGSLLS